MSFLDKCLLLLLFFACAIRYGSVSEEALLTPCNALFLLYIVASGNNSSDV